MLVVPQNELLTFTSVFFPENLGAISDEQVDNVGVYLEVHVTLQPRRPRSTSSPVWELQIS
jgi:hypothetical protein